MRFLGKKQRITADQHLGPPHSVRQHWEMVEAVLQGLKMVCRAKSLAL